MDGARPEGHKNKPRLQPPLDVLGMMAYIKINGVEALTCWDSASQLDCISPDFICKAVNELTHGSLGLEFH